MKKQKTSSARAAVATAVFTVAALFTTATTAQAGTIVFNNPTGGGSQQGYVLGMDFNVLGPIEVTELGAFDSGQDGFDGDVNVGIFDLGGALLVSTVLSGTDGALIGGSRFNSITPFLLGPGVYSIVAVGFTGGNFSGNTGLFPFPLTSFDDVNGRLALVDNGGRWASSNTFALPPGGPYPQSDPVFQAGTFGANAVPDGGSAAALLGLGLLGIGWARRRFL